MTRKDLAFENERWYYTYWGKGGKNGRRELPQPAVDALRPALTAFGREFEEHVPGRFPLAFRSAHDG